ncbi:MAG: hypothetical protein VXX36_12045 [Verrucomicrobiota bacterium]|nr:hypothetical protein [Verrucomicrobiota bacterium]
MLRDAQVHCLAAARTFDRFSDTTDTFSLFDLLITNPLGLLEHFLLFTFGHVDLGLALTF